MCNGVLLQSFQQRALRCYVPAGAVRLMQYVFLISLQLAKLND
jgi:hypothetical protein